MKKNKKIECFYCKSARDCFKDQDDKWICQKCDDEMEEEEQCRQAEEDNEAMLSEEEELYIEELCSH
jgi:hypothetical protein